MHRPGFFFRAHSLVGKIELLQSSVAGSCPAGSTAPARRSLHRGKYRCRLLGRQKPQRVEHRAVAKLAKQPV